MWGAGLTDGINWVRGGRSMAEAERISARQRAILTAIVENYIETGEPVSSGTIAGAIARVQAGAGLGAGLSSATVRNEMAELVNQGLLEQPHTSAGRVPTARAFRMYVEQLSGAGAGSGGGIGLRAGVGAHGVAQMQLRSQLESKIDSSFAGVNGTQAMLERTSHVLATVSSGVGVAMALVAGGDTLEHVHFSRLAKGRVLAVVVTSSGLVRDRMLTMESDVTAAELEVAANFLNENFRGWSIERVRAEIGRLVERERSEYQRLLSGVEQLWAGAVAHGEAEVQTVYVEGVANLLGGRGAGTAEDMARLREVLAALEAKQRLVGLLDAYIDAKQESVRVIFDLEEQAPEMAGLVLIAAPARMAGDGRGAVGVIGPKRMQYENTMNAVSYIAQVFERMLHPNA
jgi:heat-inducible transcriptional repressor